MIAAKIVGHIAKQLIQNAAKQAGLIRVGRFP